MKQKNNHKKDEKQKSKKRIKKASYIGAAALIFVGLVSATTHKRLSDISLSLENTPITLPTQVTYSLPTPSATPTIAPTKPPTPANLPAHTPSASAEPAITTAAESKPLLIILPAEGEIIKPFSKDSLLRSKTMGDWRAHIGIDIAAEPVSGVMAAADGVVEEAYNDPLMGFTIIITHPGGYQTCYQNLASTEMVSKGQTVTQGQIIAAVGHSASAELLDDSHIHFAVIKDGDDVNPIDFIKTDE